MKIPTLQGTIDRRILINYRIDPAVAARILPAPFRPQIVDGVALGGVCLIPPRGHPPARAPGAGRALLRGRGPPLRGRVGRRGRPASRRLIPRRDTDSWVNLAVGGRLFPGAHHRARFDIDEREGSIGWR